MGKRYFSISMFLGLAVAITQLPSCSLVNPPIVTPCYGHIDSIGMSSTYSTQGSASHDYSCFWVYADDQPVGAFTFPCTFPMIASSGSHTISIYPGVTANGTGATREKYPFVTFYDSAINITEGNTTKFKFTAKYNSNTYFHWREDFDNPTLTIANYGICDDTMHKNNPPNVFEGVHSGEVDLDSTSSRIQTYYTGVSDTMYLPHDGSPVFLEMNYNCNNVFGVGVIFYALPNALSGTQEGIYTYVFPSTGWKKMYIDLTGALANRPGPFCIYFTMTRQYGNSHAYMMLDNLKVLHFKAG